MHWYYKTFSELGNDELYGILKLRQDVFIIEQTCIYPDLDGADQTATHLFAKDENGAEVIAYLRIFAPGEKYAETTIGRVLTRHTHRGGGLGRTLMLEGIRVAEREYPGYAIKISAQVHLGQFYGELGFVNSSEPYDEDGIMHVDMLRA